MRRTRARSLTALVGAVALLGAGLVAVGGTPAQASSQGFPLYSQINDTASAGPVAHGTNTITMVMSPASAAVGSVVISIIILDGTYPLINTTGATIPAGAQELDAVITLNGVDYTLRGSRNNVAIPAGSTIFSSWIINSTAGSSSSIALGTTNGTTGVGTSVRGAEGTPVSLLAPPTSGVYTVGLKAIINNRITSGGTAGLTDPADEITNTDPTNAGGGPGTVGPGGPTGSFATNNTNGAVASNGNLAFTTPVTITSIGPTAAIASVTGQNAGVTAVRPPSSNWTTPTVSVGMTGANWTGGTGIGSFTFQFCNAAGAACDAVPASSVAQFQNTLATDAGGNVTGVLVITRVGCVGAGCTTPFLTTGSRTIKLVQGAKSAITPVTVLSDPLLSASPASGPQGTVVTLVGANFNPSQTIRITGISALCPGPCTLTTDGITTTTATAIGGLNTITYTVSDLDTTTLVAYQGTLGTYSATNQSATQAYAPNQDACVADVGNVNTGTCRTKQKAYSTILAGNLTQQANAAAGNPDTTSIVLCRTAAPTSPPGGVQPGNTSACGLSSQTVAASMYGNLNPVVVTDNRGGSYGWSLTATMPSLTDGTHTIANTALAVNPTCSALSAASAPGAVAGAAGQTFAGTVSLCVKDNQISFAPGSQSSGGQYAVAGLLTLTVPAFKAAGQYNSTMTINLA